MRRGIALFFIALVISAGVITAAASHASLRKVVDVATCTTQQPLAPQASSGTISASGTITCADGSTNTLSAYVTIQRAPTPGQGYCIPGPCTITWTTVAQGGHVVVGSTDTATISYLCPTDSSGGPDPGYVYRDKVTGSDGQTIYSRVYSTCDDPNLNSGYTLTDAYHAGAQKFHGPAKGQSVVHVRARGHGRTPQTAKDIYFFDCAVYIDAPQYGFVMEFGEQIGWLTAPDYNFECSGNVDIISVNNWLYIQRSQTQARGGVYVDKTSRQFCGNSVGNGVTSVNFGVCPGIQYFCQYTDQHTSYYWRTGNDVSVVADRITGMSSTKDTHPVNNAPYCA